MKLWHDDVRPPPTLDWSWASTNEEARFFLYNGKAIEDAGGVGFTECSLDHDLGADPRDGLYAKGAAEETGLQLVEWMIERGLVPEKVTIHSWNAPAAKRMQQAFADEGYEAELRPYTVSA